ncbi:Uncharacterised protein [Halioglobus japonicus]|nr:Uncharacterised protein [Halioglobus japonicus]
MTDQATEAKEQLRGAWDDMIQALQQARDAIDQPELMPPPATDRNLAEGYRYLMGYVHNAVERAFHSDPVRPSFRNALSVITRSTIDNADAIYFSTAIDGRQSYRLHGVPGDTRHWRGEEPISTGRKAPHYVIFETTSGEMPGDTGSLMELRPGVKAQTGRLDSSHIVLEDDGSFDILLAPEKPDGYTGNFISTLKMAKPAEPTESAERTPRYANHISGRQLFNDWEHEEAIHFEIAQLGAEGTHPAPYSANEAADEIRQFGAIVRNQMHFWNAFWTILMGTYGEREGSIPGVAFPRNSFNTVNAASGATGGGQSTNIYAGGVFELEPDEALVIENHIRLKPQYVGFQVGNLWGESMEYANQIGSLNGHQMTTDSDGVIRIVLAHSDPGVPNWVDTTGHREGFMTPRWTYSETPAPEDWPAITAKKVPFSEIRQHLPAETGTVAPEQRREQIRIRQQHVQRRYRMF